MFTSYNYAQIICKGCKEVTHIEAGQEFKELTLNCKCEKEPPKKQTRRKS